MTVELGRLGVWRHTDHTDERLAVEVEKLGYGALWLGGSPGGDLAIVERLLDATARLAVATSIVNVWQDSPESIAEAYHRIAAKHPGRFLLGIGAGHREHTSEFVKPYAALVNYLDRLDAAGVPAQDRALAALGPKVLRLAGERTAGANPYLVTPEHTRQARELLGDGPLIATEQKVVLEQNPDRAREIGRQRVNSYLQLSNYTANLRRIGFTEEDLAGAGSDRLVDELAVHGDAPTVAAGVNRHFSSGADHVAIQVLDADPFPAYRALAAEFSAEQNVIG